jgi:LPS-assembly lipoprotein
MGPRRFHAPLLAAARGLVQTARMTPDHPRIPPRILLRAAALAALLLLAGCGFHLRDAVLLPPDLGPLRVASADPDSSLAQELQQLLERTGTTLAADDANDVARLDIVSERWGDTPISVDQFGRSQEFTLRYAVIFDLRRADGSDLVPQQAIELSRDYISVPTSSAGTEGEREILVRELRREMVSSILRRIDAVSRMVQAQAPAALAPVPAPAPAVTMPAATP